MKLKFALSLIALLAATDSHAAFQITFRAGDAVKIIVDNGPDDTDRRLNRISGNSFFLTDSTDPNFEYTFANYSANWSRTATGLDGDLYAINASVTDVIGSSPDAIGKTVSMFASVNNLPSIIGEPARATANTTMSLQTPYASASKVADVTYGAYYDPTNAIATSPSGSSILAGTDQLFGRSTPAPDASAAFSGTVGAPSFSTSSFAMGVYYGVNVTGTGFGFEPVFTFSGSSQLEQTPEPSHTALPVGIATGLLVMRRRRVIR
jgi:hypothetical protein